MVRRPMVYGAPLLTRFRPYALRIWLNSAHSRIFYGTVECPIHKCEFFSLDKAAQGFSSRRTVRTPQPETRGERSPVEKRPFMDGH